MVAVLPSIEHMETRQAAEIMSIVQLHARSDRQGAAAQRHVFPVGLVGGGAAHEEFRIEILGAVIGVIVVHFMVVPGHEPGECGVAALQVGIGLVAGIAVAVLRQRVGFRPFVLAHVAAAPGRFIDVIAEEDHQVEFLLRQVAVRGIEALLVLLAGGEGETQAADRGAGGGRRARSANGAHGIAGHEAVPVPARRFQASHLDMHAVRMLRFGHRPSGADDGAKPLIPRDFPAHFDRRRGQAAAIHGIGRQPRP